MITDKREAAHNGPSFLLPYPGPGHMPPATGPPAACVSGLRSSVSGICLRSQRLRLPDTSRTPATSHQPPDACNLPASVFSLRLRVSVFSICLRAPVSGTASSGLRLRHPAACRLPASGQPAERLRYYTPTGW